MAWLGSEQCTAPLRLIRHNTATGDHERRVNYIHDGVGNGQGQGCGNAGGNGNGNGGGNTSPDPTAARVVYTGIEYVHTDALGSPIANTPASGTIYAWGRTQYEPYGLPLNTPRNGAPSYTGHQYDRDTGLVYAQQRYYDPMPGRFHGVDPMAVDTTSAFNFNRYAYANNSPYKFTDPDGTESACSATNIGCGLTPITPEIEHSQAVAMAGLTGIVLTAGVAAEYAPLVAAAAGKSMSSGARRQSVGAARELRAAKKFEGKVSGERITADKLGSTDIDVIAKNGDLVAVGGAAKAGNLSNLGRVLRIYSAEAGKRGVNAVAAFEKGTPEKAIKLAEKILGKDGVVIL